jgi:hypothetical protein
MIRNTARTNDGKLADSNLWQDTAMTPHEDPRSKTGTPGNVRMTGKVAAIADDSVVPHRAVHVQNGKPSDRSAT